MALNYKNIPGCYSKGFTLIELLVTMLISSMVIGAIYTTFTKQQGIYTAQDKVVEVQQDLRAGISIMASELRMAGYDPSESGLYGVTAASAGTFAFTADVNDDGGAPGTGESYQYELYDSDGDAVKDALRRTPAGSAVANNIYNLEFYYQLSDGVTWTTSPTTSQLNLIRAVKVSILARAGRTDPNFVDSKTYTTASGATWGPFNDNYRRRFLVTTVKCRNLGLWN